MSRLSAIPLLIASVVIAANCRSEDKTPQVAVEIRSQLAKRPSAVAAAVWKDVTAFYGKRENVPAWVEHKHPTERAGAAVAVLNTASSHGFDPEQYGQSDIIRRHEALTNSEKNAPDRAKQLAQFDLLVTTALLGLGRDVALGRTTPDEIASYWKSRREAPDLVASLVEAYDHDRVDQWLDRVRPPHPEYAALQRALVSLLGQQQKGGWPKVGAAGDKGKPAPMAGSLRARLAAGGHLKGDPSAATGADITAAIKSFQSLHALRETGTVDRATLAAMNVPIAERIAQVKMNLQRWRWMPDDLGERHFLVNIPHFHLFAREHGKTVMDIRVVVGKPGNETPIFSDQMEIVVFSPYWNIPESIVEGETAPAMARDPGFLARNNIEILRVSKHGAYRVDPASVNWNDPGSLSTLAFRQRPGAKNALGHVKFLFPNRFNVYLHDTPADSLFARTGRAFSHGCIRVEEPEVLAKYVLRDQPEWTDPRILHAMQAGVERQVRLKHEIPVHIAYFTSWVDDRQGLHFQPDVYGYDARQAERQFSRD